MPADLKRTNQAIDHLRAARDLLRQAGCPRAAAATMRALASAEGARRHVDHRITRSRT
ncbi:hypothetical protein [Sphingopyxis macrogoltabida]|nr:hypothetical protein [Sphingopyxis macrogoltabida]